jgi:hypothetical protein
LAENDFQGAALYTPQWVRGHFPEARVLLLHRREDLLTGDWPEEMQERAARLSGELDKGIRAFIKNHFGGADSDQVVRVGFALIDVPFGAMKRYLDAGRKIPQQVDELVLETVTAILGEQS